MTAPQLATELVRCLVIPPPLECRPRLAALMRGSASIELRYEWVKSWTIFNAIAEKSGWEFGDGAEWVSLSRLADGTDD